MVVVSGFLPLHLFFHFFFNFRISIQSIELPVFLLELVADVVFSCVLFTQNAAASKRMLSRDQFVIVIE